MNNDTSDNKPTNEDVNSNQSKDSAVNLDELINAVRNNGVVLLKTYFDEVGVTIVNQERYGPVFIFQVKNELKQLYACGFFLRELISNFQSDSDSAQWLTSFFIELMKTEGGKELPEPPTSDEEARAFIDTVLVPNCIAAVREEFPEEQVHASLDWNEEYGAVFEAGFPAIREGNNVCAFPLHLLFTHVLLNRDPAELLIQGLYKIKEEHEAQSV